MEEVGIYPDAFTYSVLINGLCKESRLHNAKELFEEMFNKGLIPNDVILLRET